MIISIAFSVAIYKVLTIELDRVEKTQRLRIERGLPERFRTQIPFDLRDELFRPFRLDTELIAETKKHLAIVLVWINFGILGASALAGYFLAGRTLKPIENSLEEQKRFVADASHEFRTPLTVLKTSMEVALRDKKMTLTDAKKVLGDNLEEVESLKSLSDKLLSLARYQSNGQSLVFKEVDISWVVEKVAKKISLLAKEKEVELRTEVKSQKLIANEESLEEMLLIFLDNAVKYTPKGGRVTVVTKADKKWLEVKVKDTGIGIAKEDLPYIFDRFYRADQSRTREHLRGGRLSLRSHDSSDGEEIGGFGLGLSLAKKIVEIHKGSVEVASVLGKGTTFTIKLPLRHFQLHTLRV